MKKGFTLIELLVVISITVVLLGISIFGIASARITARDAQRKSDLEMIRSGLEMYKSDCNTYPQSLGNSLIGDNSSAACSEENIYIQEVPTDPQTPERDYFYNRLSLYTYELCAALEQVNETQTVACGGGNDCGEACNYKVVNP